MWIFRYTYCLLEGHAFVDITATRHPYKYCLHCGKILEPGYVIKGRHLQTERIRDN
jgi:hypothetical protein